MKLKTKLLFAAGIAAAYAGYKSWRVAKTFVTETVNPASDQNFIYQGVNEIAGEENVSTAADYIFGAIDILNPFNRNDSYARQVWGLEKGAAEQTNDANKITDINSEKISE